MKLKLPQDWNELLGSELEKPYFQTMWTRLQEEYQTETVYPPQANLFEAFRLTSYAGTKVVILGQDPYHGEGQAHGLSFSVQPGVKAPPSLQNIYKELHTDLGLPIPAHGYLTAWAKQGVLLLNTVLTVQAGTPASHQGQGWELFTDQVIHLLNRHEKPLVFILWGKHAQAKAEFLDAAKHLVICSAHPSPFAARKGFFGSRPFSQTNEFLLKNDIEPVNWRLENI